MRDATSPRLKESQRSWSISLTGPYAAERRVVLILAHTIAPADLWEVRYWVWAPFANSLEEGVLQIRLRGTWRGLLSLAFLSATSSSSMKTGLGSNEYAEQLVVTQAAFLLAR